MSGWTMLPSSIGGTVFIALKKFVSSSLISHTYAPPNALPHYIVGIIISVVSFWNGEQLSISLFNTVSEERMWLAVGWTQISKTKGEVLGCGLCSLKKKSQVSKKQVSHYLSLFQWGQS